MMILKCCSRTLGYVRFTKSLRIGNGIQVPLFVRGSQFYSTDDGLDTVPRPKSATPLKQDEPVINKQQDNPTIRLGKQLTDHKVDNLERYLLVWGGKYKNVDDVPRFVSQDTMERARNKARIKINLMMCAATVLACIGVVMMGKKAQREGASLTRQNLDWHKQNKEVAAKSE